SPAVILCFSSIPLPPRSTLFPYTTLFRSCERGCAEQLRSGGAELSARRQTMPDRVDELGKSRRGNGVREHPLVGRLFEAVQEARSEEHTSELQSRFDLVCRLLLEKKTQNQ